VSSPTAAPPTERGKEQLACETHLAPFAAFLELRGVFRGVPLSPGLKPFSASLVIGLVQPQALLFTFVTSTTKVRLAPPCVPITRQQPTDGKMT
jgi:hypothetical protein